MESQEIAIRSSNQFMMKAETSKAIEEVRSAFVMAKQFPRDEILAEQKIMNACKRYSLALIALYNYPRAGKAVIGPSIRLMEAIAQYWGNISSGFRVIEMRDDSATVESFAIDLETNVRKSKIFDVSFYVETRKGTKRLTDPRDIYELIANYATRRERECLRAVMPRDITNMAQEAVSRTLELGDKSQPPLSDRIKNMVIKFSEVGVSKDMIEKKLGHGTDLITGKQFVELIGVFNAIRDGHSTRESYFEFTQTERNKVTSSLNEKLGITALPQEPVQEPIKQEVSQPPEAQQPSEPEPIKKPTNAQIKQLVTDANKSKGWAAFQLSEFIKSAFGRASSNDLTMTEFEQLKSIVTTYDEPEAYKRLSDELKRREDEVAKQ